MNNTTIRPEDLAKQRVMDAVRAKDAVAYRAAADAAPAAALHENDFIHTVLGVAVCLKSRDIVRDLLRRGADPRTGYGPQYSILVTAAEIGDRDILADLLEVAPGFALQEALNKASMYDNVACMTLLIDSGADVRWGESDALKWAIIRDAREAIRLLVDAGADVDAAGAAAMQFQNHMIHPKRRQVNATIDWIKQRAEATATIGEELRLY